ncbi:MAG: hypothetical protein JRJ87_12725, partial [Deltaproteobacteria bacterium]|nr:hypothetical protein [Deltaproteobacteria bacterium]
MALRLLLIGLFLFECFYIQAAELTVCDCDVVEVIAEDPQQERLAVKLAGLVCKRAKQ